MAKTISGQYGQPALKYIGIGLIAQLRVLQETIDALHESNSSMKRTFITCLKTAKESSATANATKKITGIFAVNSRLSARNARTRIRQPRSVKHFFHMFSSLAMKP